MRNCYRMTALAAVACLVLGACSKPADGPIESMEEQRSESPAVVVAAPEPKAPAEPAAVENVEEPKKLNVLHIMSDDLFSRLGCYGDPVVQTPSLDRLAERGVRFERAYCQYPLCNASRASYMTGLRPDTTKAYKNQTDFREAVPDAVTLPQAFKNAGYFVARVGKVYHYGVPKHIGSHGMDDPASWEQVVNPKGRDVDEYSLVEVLELNDAGETVAVNDRELNASGGVVSWHAAEGADAEQTDGIGAAEAIELMEARAADGQPFYLAVGFYRPHTPFVAPKAYFDRYPLDTIEVPEVRPDNDSLFPEAALLSRKPAETAMGEELRRRAIQAYYASTTFMDAQAGLLLDALERLGLTENTIVVFNSDHGFHLGEKNLWRKQSLFEESARVPLLISVPGMAAGGAACKRTVELVSLHKTLAELCGLTPDPRTEGTSLVSLLNNPAAPWDHPAYTQQMRFNRNDPDDVPYMGRSVRTERWRYTEWGEGKMGTELYDHDNDPGEMNNLAADPEHQEIVREMRAILAAMGTSI